MAENDPRHDLPEADKAEQEREAWPDAAQDDTDPDIDPLKASEADQLDQVREVATDDDHLNPDQL